MFVCAFWSILLLLEYKNHNKSKFYLGVYMVVAFLLYLGHAAYFNREYGFYGFWENIYMFCSLAVYPLYYIYLKLISKKMSLEVRDLWILIPSFFMLIFSFAIYASMTGDEMNFYITNIIYNKNYKEYVNLSSSLFAQITKLRLFSIIFFAQLIPIVYFGRKHILEYNKKIQNYYSDTEGKTLLHFNKLLYIFIATSITSSIANILGKSFFTHSTWLLLIPALLFGLLLFIIGYLGYKQDFTLETFMIDVTLDDVKNNGQSDIEINNGYNEAIKQRLLLELNDLLSKKEIYKKPDIRITDISKKLNTNRTYISRVVNEELNTSFSDLINKHRVEHAKKLLREKDCKAMGLSQIGELSGFKSDSSFYRIFKEKEGVSPGDFRKKINANCD